MTYQVVARFFHQASDRYIDPGQDCPLLPAEDAARLVRARCLVEVLDGPAAGTEAPPPPHASRKGRQAPGGGPRLRPETPPPPKE